MVATGMFSTSLLQSQYKRPENNNYNPTYSRSTGFFNNSAMSNLYSRQQEIYQRSVFSRNVLPVKETYMNVKGGFPKGDVVETLLKRAMERPGDFNDSNSQYMFYNEPKGFLAHIYKGNIINTFA